ncbi:MAG: transposase [Xanthomonadaceae bacterium]|nr:transposase [Xanthomonadaceae bacterium]
MRQVARKYTDEFKKQAVDLAQELDSIALAATKLGISTANIYDWRKKHEATQEVSVSQMSAVEREELNRLRNEVSELKK